MKSKFYFVYCVFILFCFQSFGQIELNVWKKNNIGKTSKTQQTFQSPPKSFASSTPDNKKVVYEKINIEPIKVSTSSGKTFYYNPESYRSRDGLSVLTFSKENGWTGFYENKNGEFWSMSSTKVSKDLNNTKNLENEPYNDISFDKDMKSAPEVDNTKKPPIGRTWTNEQFYDPLIPINKTCSLYIEVSRNLYTRFSNQNAVLEYVNNLFLGVKTLYSREGVYFKLNKVYLWDTPVSPLPYDFWAYSDINKFQSNINLNNPTNPESHFKMMLCYTTSPWGGNANNGVAKIGHYQGDGYRYPILGGLPADRMVSVIDLKNNNQVEPLNPDPTDVINFKEPVVVCAHELGHNFGCQHTHWCGYKNDIGQYARIDSCKEAQTELSSNPNCGDISATIWSKQPTIMSYCAFYKSNTIGLPYFENGINVGGLMSRGFGKYPRQVVRASLYSATQIPFDVSSVPPTVTTNETITNIQSSTATASGEVTNIGDSPIINAGICWSSTNSLPTKSDNFSTATMGSGFGTGTFESNLIDLSGGTLYYVRSFATNLSGTSYGNVVTFTTLASTIPTIELDLDLNTTTNSSIFALGKNIIAGGGFIESKGFAWAISPNEPDIYSTESNTLFLGTGSNDFSNTVSGLAGSTTYNIKSFAINSAGIGYSSTRTFTTYSDDVNFKPLTFVRGSTRARFSCGIFSDGGSTITQKGFCWSTSPNPTTSDNNSTNGPIMEDFTSLVESLTPSTLYYVRAYLTNGNGTFYSEQITFTTSSETVVTTLPAGGITVTSFNGYMSLVRTETIPQSGILVSTNPNVTITNYQKIWTNNPPPAVTNQVAHPFTNLSAKTIYYVRGFAKDVFNKYYYGNEIVVKTLGSPDVETMEALNIQANSAELYGFCYENGFPITKRGFVWSSFFTTPILPANPNMFVSENGTGGGDFLHNPQNLQPNTTYRFRAYAINSIGTSYGNILTFTTPSNIVGPEIVTFPAAAITSTSASCGGNVLTDGGAFILSKGIVYSTNPEPTTQNSTVVTEPSYTDIGGFGVNIPNLTPGTLYYVRAYATNIYGTYYGNEITFTTTSPIPPTVITNVDLTSITNTSVIAGGEVISDGGSPITNRGVCYKLRTNPPTEPTIDDFVVSSGSNLGSFSSTIGSLQSNQIYDLRAFATNINGTSYGSSVEISVKGPPILTTKQITSITSSSASSGGIITNLGGVPLTETGVCWSTSTNPTISLSTKTNDPYTFISPNYETVSSITNLQPLQNYYVRAYATNIYGTSYGNELQFTSAPPPIPTVTTAVSAATTSSSIISGGTVVNQGGGPVIQRGVIWSLNSGNIDINLSTKTLDGIGTGTFSSNISSGIQPNTTYYIKAYAKNSFGVGYGDMATVQTPPTGNTQCGIEGIEVYEGPPPTWYTKFNLNPNCQYYKVEVSRYTSNPTNNPNLQPIQTYTVSNANPVNVTIQDIQQGYVVLEIRPRPSNIDPVSGTWFSLNITCRGGLCVPNRITKYYFYVDRPR